jgi:hypothetical protein
MALHGKTGADSKLIGGRLAGDPGGWSAGLGSVDPRGAERLPEQRYRPPEGKISTVREVQARGMKVVMVGSLPVPAGPRHHGGLGPLATCPRVFPFTQVGEAQQDMRENRHGDGNTAAVGSAPAEGLTDLPE